MLDLPTSLQHLIEQLARLPGIGSKTAQRMAYNLVEMNEKDALDIARAIVDMKRKLHLCSRCHYLTEDELCQFCTNTKRNAATICVVDTPRDLLAIERTREYKGLYHVLHGRISPLDGVRPQDLFIDSLTKRVEEGGVEEIILANSPTLEGEATAVYLSKLLQGMVPRITRIAHGVPVGGDLEFSDEITVLKAMEGRHRY